MEPEIPKSPHQAELERAKSVATHMEACRALLGVPNDEVLYEAIRTLQKQCAAMRSALEEILSAASDTSNAGPISDGWLIEVATAALQSDAGESG
jgi:hypothetical protein